MANEKHLAILNKGVSWWNQWLDVHHLPDLSGANLNGANLNGVNFRGVNLAGANLKAADLNAAFFVNANLTDVTLIGANLMGADLRGANLTGADMTRAKLIGANLRGANLTDADLTNAHLDDAHLNDANLTGAVIISADLAGANLANATLKGASLAWTNLSNTILRGADFNGATISYTLFSDCDLRYAYGLDSVSHTGPSTIGIDTIYRSAGEIPDHFLRGCGVPEGFITQMRSLVGAEEGFQFHSCFISYSHRNEQFATRLYERMRTANLRVWYAPEDMPGGKKLHEEIETQIHLFDKLLLVLSEESMQSEWVATEIYHARQREKKEGRQILFPIGLCPFEAVRKWKSFDSDTGKDMAREVREYFIPDFSTWKDHDTFELSFARLLKALRNGDRKMGITQ